MPKNGKDEPVVDEQSAPETVTPEQPAPEPTPEELMAQLQKAISEGNFKEVTAISRKIDQKQRAIEKAELDAKRQELELLQENVKQELFPVIKSMYDSGVLDKADGVWLAWDFGEPESSASVRLMKTQAKVRTGGGGTGKKFDVSTDSLLGKYGEEPYKETGMTFRQAYDSNTDKNWRYAIRQALLKKDGII